MDHLHQDENDEFPKNVYSVAEDYQNFYLDIRIIADIHAVEVTH